jgi:nucleoside-diphosphate-sugar epimerase
MVKVTSTLIGSTGFVGSTLAASRPFDAAFHRSDITNIRGMSSELTICAGLPAAKYLANQEPERDWRNMASLAEELSHLQSDRFVLVSSVDVYQPAKDVDERDRPQLDGNEAYGRNRAWFELFVKATFSNHQIVRLPGLFAPGLRKNLVFDLLEGREDQWRGVNALSRFQFFDVATLWDVIDRLADSDVRLLNVACEPIRAQDVADLFGVSLSSSGRLVEYDMRTVHTDRFGGSDGYLISAEDQLHGIEKLRSAWTRQ